MPDFEPSAVSKAIWNWNRPPPPPRKGHSLGKVLIQVALPLMAAAIFYCFRKPIPAYVLCGVAAFVLVSGLFIPPVFAAIGRAAALVGVGAGVGLTWLLLVPFYYLVFAPARLMQRVTGRDPLNRKFPSDEPTYWTPRPPVAVEQYRKQH